MRNGEEELQDIRTLLGAEIIIGYQNYHMRKIVERREEWSPSSFSLTTRDLGEL